MHFGNGDKLNRMQLLTAMLTGHQGGNDHLKETKNTKIQQTIKILTAIYIVYSRTNISHKF